MTARIKGQNLRCALLQNAVCDTETHSRLNDREPIINVVITSMDLLIKRRFPKLDAGCTALASEGCTDRGTRDVRQHVFVAGMRAQSHFC